MAAAGDLQDLPLPILFRRAEAAFARLQSSPSSPDQAQLITDAIACVHRASALVDSLGLFSANEDKDDLATADVKYFLIPYFHAEFLAAQQFPQEADPRSRLNAVTSSLSLHQSFLNRALQYGLLSATTQQLVKTVVGDLSSAEAAVALSKPQKIDATLLRELKIERFKLEKSVSARLAALEKSLGSKKNEENSGGRAAVEDEEDEDFESIERELGILKIEAAALKSIDSLRSLQQEAEVLAHVASLSKEDRAAQHRSRQAAGPPPELMAELRKAAGALRLGSDAAQRETLRQQVFRPSHILPMMTVEQQGDIEVAQLMAQQRAEKEREAAATAARAARGRKADDSDADDEEYDEKVMRQRAMDDWKDDNPRGWGNSKLRPCG